MNLSFFTLAVTAAFTLGHLPARSQTTTSNSPGQHNDSLYYVHLRNGNTLYSKKVRLMSSLTRGNYLLLDSNRRMPLSQAKDFNGWQGTYAIADLGGGYDAYRLQNEGARISLYTQCYTSSETVYAATTPGGAEFPTTITTHEKAFFFRKDTGDVQRANYHNLSLATADNPASTQQLRIAHTNIVVGIGLLGAGVALVTTGIITTINHNHQISTAYDQAAAKWYQQAQTNANTPMPALPHYSGPSPLFYLGTAMTLSAGIPLFSVRRHTQMALDIYNGIE
jgi:hypothetical protein